MSTAETGEEVKEDKRSKSSGIEESKEEEETSPTTKTKVVGFDKHNIEDIMSSDSYIKNIPAIKAGITAAEFVVKEVALKSVLAIKNYSVFYSETKHKSLPMAVQLTMKRMQPKVI